MGGNDCWICCCSWDSWDGKLMNVDANVVNEDRMAGVDNGLLLLLLLVGVVVVPLL